MSLIDESKAWDILSGYVADCLRIDVDSLVAVYAIGSLTCNAYRPGESDIDAVLIVAEGSEDIWGAPTAASEQLAHLNRLYLETYHIPKDFGPFPIQEHRFYPPYLPEDELVPEIARLKIQGEAVFGGYDLDRVPMPTVDDFLAYVRHFEQWFEDEFLNEHPFETFSARACANTMLMHMSRFLWVKWDEIEFNKRAILPKYMTADPPFIGQDMLELLAAARYGPPLSDEELWRLREFTRWMREELNDLLGATPE